MIEELYKHFLNSRKVSTDTRKIDKDSIFFALKGPNFNANAFADEALEKGASFVVIDESEYKKDERYLLVDDVLQTLQTLANHHRKQLDIPVIGLTGSNGKTTTKELINAVLSEKFKVLATQGNLNNHIGVPLTLLSINEQHDIAIIEMGANHVGEIAALCEIAAPTHGFITNIGKAHLEGFGGFEGVIRGKSELYHYLIQHDGTIWVNSANEILSNMAKRMKKPLFYPQKGDYYHCELTEVKPFLTIETEEGETITTQLVGKYNFENIAVALAIGKFFEVDAKLAHAAIAAYSPSNNRSQIIKKGSNTIILDAYNANPNSMTSALENLRLMDHESKGVVLGDMKELGESSKEEHENICGLLKEAQLKYVFLFGPEFESACNDLPDVFHTTDKSELKAKIKATQIENAAILIKGSRSMGLEAVVEDIA